MKTRQWHQSILLFAISCEHRTAASHWLEMRRRAASWFRGTKIICYLDVMTAVTWAASVSLLIYSQHLCVSPSLVVPSFFLTFFLPLPLSSLVLQLVLSFSKHFSSGFFLRWFHQFQRFMARAGHLGHVPFSGRLPSEEPQCGHP